MNKTLPFFDVIGKAACHDGRFRRFLRGGKRNDLAVKLSEQMLEISLELIIASHRANIQAEDAIKKA